MTALKKQTGAPLLRQMDRTLLALLVRTRLRFCRIFNDVCKPGRFRTSPCLSWKANDPFQIRAWMQYPTICLPPCMDPKCPGEPGENRGEKANPDHWKLTRQRYGISRFTVSPPDQCASLGHLLGLKFDQRICRPSDMRTVVEPVSSSALRLPEHGLYPENSVSFPLLLT